MSNRLLGLEVEKIYDLTWNKDGQDDLVTHTQIM